MELSPEEVFACLLEKINETKCLINECKSLSDISGKAKLQRKIQAELRFLEKLSKNPDKLKEEHIRSSNIYHLSAIVQCCLDMQGVIKVLETFSYIEEDGENEYERTLVVDIVADYGSTWVKVATRNPIHLYQTSIGLGKYGRKSIVDQVQDMVYCAEQNLHMFTAPKVIVRLAAGVTEELKALLDKLNVQVIADIVSGETDERTSTEKLGIATEFLAKQTSSLQTEIENDLAQSFNDLVNVDPSEGYFNMQSLPAGGILNLDVSTFLAYVSNMTNGFCFERYNEKLLTDLAKMEQARPVKIILDRLFESKKLICCETAHRDFLEILSTVGGKKEKQRATEMLKSVTVVPDNPSPLALTLEKTSKIKDRSKIVFGTGDMMKVVTVSANLGFLRAARSQCVRFVAFVHESRALTECKEIKDDI